MSEDPQYGCAVTAVFFAVGVLVLAIALIAVAAA